MDVGRGPLSSQSVMQSPDAKKAQELDRRFSQMAELAGRRVVWLDPEAEIHQFGLVGRFCVWVAKLLHIETKAMRYFAGYSDCLKTFEQLQGQVKSLSQYDTHLVADYVYCWKLFCKEFAVEEAEAQPMDQQIELLQKSIPWITPKPTNLFSNEPIDVEGPSKGFYSYVQNLFHMLYEGRGSKTLHIDQEDLAVKVQLHQRLNCTKAAEISNLFHDEGGFADSHLGLSLKLDASVAPPQVRTQIWFGSDKMSIAMDGCVAMLEQAGLDIRHEPTSPGFSLFEISIPAEGFDEKKANALLAWIENVQRAPSLLSTKALVCASRDLYQALQGHPLLLKPVTGEKEGAYLTLAQGLRTLFQEEGRSQDLLTLQQTIADYKKRSPALPLPEGGYLS